MFPFIFCIFPTFFKLDSTVKRMSETWTKERIETAKKLDQYEKEFWEVTIKRKSEKHKWLVENVFLFLIQSINNVDFIFWNWDGGFGEKRRRGCRRNAAFQNNSGIEIYDGLLTNSIGSCQKIFFAQSFLKKFII